MPTFLLRDVDGRLVAEIDARGLPGDLPPEVMVRPDHTVGSPGAAALIGAVGRRVLADQTMRGRHERRAQLAAHRQRPPGCRVCADPRRSTIEARLAEAEVSPITLARDLRLHLGDLCRHRDGRCPGAGT